MTIIVSAGMITLENSKRISQKSTKLQQQQSYISVYVPIISYPKTTVKLDT